MANTDEKSKEPAAPVSNNGGIEDISHDLYPERRGQKLHRNWWTKFLRFDEQEDWEKIKCETNVYKCLKNSPLVKLMLAALKSSGCEIDIRRHISCELCDKKVTGGYDPKLNQIIICQNNAYKQMIQGVLSHEMIHMFDVCRNNVDLNNLDHLACTEIRAANLCHCSFLSAWTQGFASPFNIKKAHQYCVKDKAMQSILAVRKVSEEEARNAVLRVFDKCYNDLEPVGRRLRRNSEDMEKAYMEGPLYGYTD